MQRKAEEDENCHPRNSSFQKPTPVAMLVKCDQTLHEVGDDLNVE